MKKHLRITQFILTTILLIKKQLLMKKQLQITQFILTTTPLDSIKAKKLLSIFGFEPE